MQLWSSVLNSAIFSGGRGIGGHGGVVNQTGLIAQWKHASIPTTFFFSCECQGRVLHAQARERER